MRAGGTIVFFIACIFFALGTADDYEECAGVFHNKCPENFVCITDLSPKSCLPLANEANGYICKYNEQCSDIRNSECANENEGDDGICQCTEEGYVIQNGVCVEDIKECDVDDRCDDGYVCITGEDPKVCLPVATEDNGYACSYNEQCSDIEETECVTKADDGVCQCKQDGYVIEDGKCVEGKPECTGRMNSCPEGTICIVELEPKLCYPVASEEDDYTCSYDEQCSGIDKDSECVIDKGEDEGVCQCTGENVIFSGDGCKKVIGAECSLLNGCNDIENAHCAMSLIKKGKCECDKGYEASEDLSYCQLQSNGTDDNHYYCELNSQCANIYEEDDEGNQLPVKCNRWNNACTCNDKGKHPKNDECVPGLTSSCVRNEECHDRVTNSQCIKGQCACMDGYMAFNDGFHCGEYPSEKNGYMCDADEQCETLGRGLTDKLTCADGQCSCGADNVIIDGQCVHGKIGGECGLLLPFPSCDIKNSHCTSKGCQCDRGFSPSEDSRVCGYQCDASNPCDGNFTVCSKGVCQCHENFVAVYDDQELRCMEIASRENGFSCDYQEQCNHIVDSGLLSEKPAVCNNETHTCQCGEDNFSIHDNKCLRGIGADCRSFINKCEMPNTKCNLFSNKLRLLKGKCDCQWGFQEMEGFCEPFECRYTLRCPKHADCNQEENLCICKDGYVMLDQLLRDKCVPLSSPEDDFSCEITSQCSNIEDISSGSNQTVECDKKSNKCQCVQDRWAPAEIDEGLYECAPGAGASCQDHAECRLGNPDSSCSDGVCICNEGFVAVDSTRKCAPVSNITDQYACSYDEQCQHIPDSSAKLFAAKTATCNAAAGACTCADAAYIIFEDNNNPTCVQGLGGSCSQDFSCRSVKNSACLPDKDGNSVCQCMEGYMLPEHELECIPYATEETDYACNRDEACSFITDDFEQFGGSAKCIDRKCSCSAEDWFMYGPNGAGQVKCARELGSKCSRNEDCYNYIPNSTCEDTCVCVDGAIADSNGRGCSGGSTIIVSLLTIVSAYLVAKSVS